MIFQLFSSCSWWWLLTSYSNEQVRKPNRQLSILRQCLTTQSARAAAQVSVTHTKTTTWRHTTSLPQFTRVLYTTPTQSHAIRKLRPTPHSHSSGHLPSMARKLWHCTQIMPPERTKLWTNHKSLTILLSVCLNQARGNKLTPVNDYHNAPTKQCWSNSKVATKRTTEWEDTNHKFGVI